jgi:DNA-binding transcriptional MerR regulator
LRLTNSEPCRNSFRRLDTSRLKELINDPLLTSARVLDGLFYSAVVVVEADSDARFYHAASVKQSLTLDIHFVNADNKQTVPRILKLYCEMGVRSAGIVDFDILNDRTELKKSLQTLGFADEDIQRLLEMQRQIGQAAKELPTMERLDGVQAKLNEMLAKIDHVTKQSFPSPEDEQREIDSLLRQLESRFRELADMTKAWKQLKQFGFNALPPGAAAAFNNIWRECADHGLFINQAGELESTLTEYGIPWTTGKKDWITRTLNLIPSLETDDTKSPWKLLRAVHKYLDLSAT